MALKWTSNHEGGQASPARSQLRTSIKAAAIGSAIGLGTLMSAPAMALKTDFGMEYRATAFAVQSDAFDGGSGTSETDNGIGHLIRVKANFLDEDTGISVYTSVELAGDRWTGDDRKYGTTNPQGFNTSSRGDNVRLDLGYVQIPVGHTIFRVGRQATSYNNCFLTCDDRRDRVLMIQPLNKTTTMVLGYDRRADTNTFANQDNGDMVLLGVTGKLSESWNAGLLFVKWMDNYDGTVAYTPTPYALNGVNLVSGYVTGGLGDVAKATLGFNHFSDGKVEGAADEQYFTDQSPSGYFRLEGDVGPMNWGVQYVTARDGGLIAPGFDTYSSLINSNPDATQSATSMYRMGGTLGVKDYDEDLVIGKLTWNVTDKFAVTGAVGQLSVDNALIDADDDSMVYDLQFAYQVNKALRTWLSVGMLEKNKAGTLSGNGLIGSLSGMNTFADDDVKAASLNMTVNF
ncbi:hypothetical protein ACRYJU_12950 [Alloalcanivorax xenomutans]|uniref:Uncharacterized protein n=1 Tax=Alcanivorax xiamenensis TaxID=1177156 RepID=A0ABQ6Y6W9_9GAMM|nr:MULTISPECIES: hypothetical protein [Alcanivoracaceae]KAF0805084.1 hypothetical protein A6D6_02594 [Alcanivorax xiamenensis]CUR47941.1 hypothetical protein BN2364_3500 [Alloalcanivorax xenomutans]